MSKYTTEVRYICEVNAGLTESDGYNSIDTIINKSMDKIFDFNYPIYDESYRRVLQAKILKHYYTREIGADTVSLWKLFLNRRMNEIMPYYNKLYRSELFEFNPLYDVDLTTEHTRTGNETGKNDTSKLDNRKNDEINTLNTTNETTSTSADTGTIEDDGSSSNTKTLNTTTTSTDSGTEGKTGSDVKKNTRWDIYSDTPQGGLTNVENENYLTNARKITDDGTGSTFSETTTFGKVNTARETGTVSDAGANANTRTLNTETETHTNSETTQQGNIKTNETASSNTNQTHNISTTEDYIEHVTGKNGGGSYAKMLLEYRDTLLNIDTMIINELSDLFLNLW